jgi:hypothetical protein
MHSICNAELIRLNVGWLHDALQLAGAVDDAAWSTSPVVLPGQRVGSHIRHILDFHDCLLDGMASGRINYDARRRDERVTADRLFAAKKIQRMIRSFDNDARLREERGVLVNAEGGEDWLPSTISRELQALSNHTIHHFALIAVILRLHGIFPDPEFGVSPSTLRYQAARFAEAA